MRGGEGRGEERKGGVRKEEEGRGEEREEGRQAEREGKR